MREVRGTMMPFAGSASARVILLRDEVGDILLSTQKGTGEACGPICTPPITTYDVIRSRWRFNIIQVKQKHGVIPHMHVLHVRDQDDSFTHPFLICREYCMHHETLYLIFCGFHFFGDPAF